MHDEPVTQNQLLCSVQQLYLPLWTSWPVMCPRVLSAIQLQYRISYADAFAMHAPPSLTAVFLLGQDPPGMRHMPHTLTTQGKAAKRTTEAPGPTQVEWLGSCKTAPTAHKHAQSIYVVEQGRVEWEDCRLLLAAGLRSPTHIPQVAGPSWANGACSL